MKMNTFFIMIDWTEGGRNRTSAWLSGVTETSGSVAASVVRAAQKPNARVVIDGELVETAQVLSLFAGAR